MVAPTDGRTAVVKDQRHDRRQVAVALGPPFATLLGIAPPDPMHVAEDLHRRAGIGLRFVLDQHVNEHWAAISCSRPEELIAVGFRQILVDIAAGQRLGEIVAQPIPYPWRQIELVQR